MGIHRVCTNRQAINVTKCALQPNLGARPLTGEPENNSAFPPLLYYNPKLSGEAPGMRQHISCVLATNCSVSTSQPRVTYLEGGGKPALRCTSTSTRPQAMCSETSRPGWGCMASWPRAPAQSQSPVCTIHRRELSDATLRAGHI